MATDADRLTRVETRVDTLTEQTGELRGAYQHLASKQDIALVRGELRGIKVGLWIIGAAIVLTEALGRLGV